MPTTAQQLHMEERRQSLLDLLQIKFGLLDRALRARIEVASPAQITAWLRRMVVVDALEKVFAD